ncbi:UDP-glycosyltransferase 76B1-like [Syzygium oleosum]|uniref:UDP-glycosyltransferase 76B1-like n=1 Tax=Syzygium oleosum TaxID=219896 RepID=UPI0011D215DE|nr:UDP-glycosyltransferase 76B1-like [Syzygium oleosum]
MGYLGSQSRSQLKKENGHHKIVLFPFPLQGHINSMLQLASILHSQGFNICIVHTQYNSPNPRNFPHFTFNSFPDGLLETEYVSESDLLAFIARLNISCTVPFRDCLQKVLCDDSEDPVACLITDGVWYFSQVVADELKIPRIVLRSTSISSISAFSALSALSEKGCLPIKDSELDKAVPEVPPLKMKDLPVVHTKNPEDLQQILANMGRETRASSGLICNSSEELEGTKLAKARQAIPIPIFVIGPFHKYFIASSSSLLAQDMSSISWLNKQKPKSVIYVSLGSIASINAAKFLEIALGLVNSEQPFLWVVRPGSICGLHWLEHLPSSFLEMLNGRGHIVKWAPQQEVLAHQAIGGFWTHCGWNSTMESICEGVPMICMPSFGDQKVNARYVSDFWRVGLHLEDKLERGEIERTIRRLMADPAGEAIRDRAVSLKDKVDQCFKEGGSSYRSLYSLTGYLSSLSDSAFRG